MAACAGAVTTKVAETVSMGVVQADLPTTHLYRGSKICSGTLSVGILHLDSVISGSMNASVPPAPPLLAPLLLARLLGWHRYCSAHLPTSSLPLLLADMSSGCAVETALLITRARWLSCGGVSGGLGGGGGGVVGSLPLPLPAAARTLLPTAILVCRGLVRGVAWRQPAGCAATAAVRESPSISPCCLCPTSVANAKAEVVESVRGVWAMRRLLCELAD